jgi:hypothetical protein
MAVTTAIFGVFLLILVGLEGQLRKLDRSSRVELMTHPENISVLTRLRRDSLDAISYPASFAGELQTPHTLILATDVDTTVVWKFEGSRATRFEYSGAQLAGSWTASGVPTYRIVSYEMPEGGTAVRLQGRDGKERLTVDAIFQPRTQ